MVLRHQLTYHEMKKWCKCGKRIPGKDTYCENCNILFYNRNKRSSKSKENNKMIDEEKVEESKEEEVSEEAEKATETSE